ncbi:GNAT family N-acetyltransferase [Brevibacillus migulae]|uniref:GNAT family N-acetyltransferase n=1 Tax=Brevibacillus migulae TaxID=1644114 RepID=UPI00106EA99D|nr:GNAT family protein [Brevibacillus migulae]
MSLEYRILLPTDAAAYVALRLEGLQHNPESFGNTYEETMQDPNLLETFAKRLQPTEEAATFGAFAEGQLVSVVTVKRETMKKVRHKASVVGVYTTPAARGKGIAKQLFHHALAWAQQQEGLEQLILSVLTDNEPALRLYRSWGFEVYGTETHALKYEGVYYDEHHMVLFLNRLC